MTEEDIKWAWAASKKGTFPFDAKDPGEFRGKFIDWAQEAVEVFLVEAGKPIAVFWSKSIAPEIIEPHAVWFPWATNRSQLEAVVHFINEQRKARLVWLFIEMKDNHFYAHVAKYGILRRVGTFEEFPGAEGRVAVWEAWRLR